MRRWAAVVMAVAVAVGAPVAWARRDERGNARSARPGEPLLTAPSPVAVRVVSEVDDTAGLEPRRSQDVLLVRLPFDVRIEHRDATGAALVSGLVVNRAASFRLEAASVVAALSGARPPGPLPGTYSAAALAAAVAAGAAERSGDGRVAGEDCRRSAWRDLDSVPLQRPTVTDRVEVCVTADGIAIEETATLAGRVVRHARAVTIERSAALIGDPFLQESPPSAPCRNAPARPAGSYAARDPAGQRCALTGVGAWRFSGGSGPRRAPGGRPGRARPCGG